MYAMGVMCACTINSNDLWYKLTLGEDEKIRELQPKTEKRKTRR